MDLKTSPDLFQHKFFIRPDFLVRIVRVTADQIDVLALFNITIHFPARHSACY